MADKYGKEDLIDLAEISRDFLHYFAPSLSREVILEEIKRTRAAIKGKVVLDVKGITEEEERNLKA